MSLTSEDAEFAVAIDSWKLGDVNLRADLSMGLLGIYLLALFLPLGKLFRPFSSKISHSSVLSLTVIFPTVASYEFLSLASPIVPVYSVKMTILKPY